MKIPGKKIDILSFLAGFSIFLLFSCNGNKSKYTDNPTSGKIKVSADETFKPILDAEIDVFQAIYKNATIEAAYMTETDALNDLIRDSVRLIIASRPLTKEEHAFFNGKKFFPKELKIAIDGIALITNKENPDTLMSVNTFRKILLGQINTWSQVNPKSKLKETSVIFDNLNSSTVRFMLDSVCDGGKISDKHAALQSNTDVINFVAKNKNAIGVIGVSWVSDKDDSTMLSFLKKVNVVALSSDSIATRANSYQPYQAYIAKGYYPFTRNIYVINSEPRVGLATGLASFLASERGQRIILKTGILPATQPYRIIEVKNDF
jgi:phosphate transport system substrate-binding protein